MTFTDATSKDVTRKEMTMPTITVPLVRFDAELPLPAYAHADDAGLDLMTTADITLEPGERRLVGTGIGIELPSGYAAFVHPRSGLAAKHGITIVNAPGTVDAGYRGEIKVCLLNTDRSASWQATRGDRIAQLVIQPVVQAVLVETGELSASRRGDSGHGSTGV